MIKPMMAKCIPVSAIIPCYRCSRTIERAIASVAAQTRPPNEVILVDDGSSDGTLEVIRDLGRQYPLEWIRIIDLPQNVGPGKARNIGWDAARQPIIAFLDADDVWHPQKLEIQYHWMMNHPDVVLTGHGYRLISERSAAAGPPEYWQASRIPPYRFLLKNPFSTPSAMLQRDLPYRFDTEKGHSEDYLLWSIIGLNGYPVWYLDLPLAYVGKAVYGESGQTKNLLQMEVGELDTYIKLYKHGLISFVALFGLSIYSIVKFFRRSLILGARRSHG